jgi:hypothetical protein
VFDFEARIFPSTLDLSVKMFLAQCFVFGEALASSLQCRSLIARKAQRSTVSMMAFAGAAGSLSGTGKITFTGEGKVWSQ